MNFVPQLTPLAAAPAPEISPSVGEATTPSQPATDFNELVALIGAFMSNKAPDDAKTISHTDPQTDARKTPSKKAPSSTVDAEYAHEPALSVIAAALIEIAVDSKQTKMPALADASIELPQKMQIAPPTQQSSEREPPGTANAGDDAAPEARDPSSLVRVKHEALSLPSSNEGLTAKASEKAETIEPQPFALEAQSSPDSVIENNRLPSPIIPTSSHYTPLAHRNAPLPTSIPASAPLISLGNIDQGSAKADRSFVVLTTKQLPDGSFELRLDPPELGSVRISLTPDDSGAIRALVTADRTETLDIVRRHIEVFRAEAGNHGLNNLEFRFESGSQNKNGADPERKRPATRVSDAMSAGFDNDAAFSAALRSGVMDFLA